MGSIRVRFAARYEMGANRKRKKLPGYSWNSKKTLSFEVSFWRWCAISAGANTDDMIAISRALRFQLGVEAIIPINSHTGNNVGVVGQLHFYLDDILPKVFGKPLIIDDS